MSKDAWFQEFERLYNEREAGEVDMTDEDLSEMASERLRDQMADKADLIWDERKEGGRE